MRKFNVYEKEKVQGKLCCLFVEFIKNFFLCFVATFCRDFEVLAFF